MFAEGFKATLALTTALLQVYVDAPLAVNVVELVLQMVLIPETLSDGSELTVMVVTGLLVLVQPAVLVPKAVYVTDMVGEKEIPFEKVPRDELKVYVLAPLPLSAVVPLRHITELTGVTETEGKGLTKILAVALEALIQPAALVPATVYEVVADGVTTAEPPP